MFTAAHGAGVQIVSVGANPRRDVITFELPSASARTWAETVVAGLQVPCGLVETVIGGPVHLL